MPSETAKDRKSLIYVVGGSSSEREEIAYNLKNFYAFRLFKSESHVLNGLSSTIPNAIIVDVILPPKGGASLIAKIRSNNKTRSVPIVFTALEKHAGLSAEAASYDNVFLVERPFARSSFRKALSAGINAGIETKWESIEPVQQAALNNTLSSFNLVADLVGAGKPIPYGEVRDNCTSLVQAVQDNNFKDILSGVSQHDNYTYVHSLRVATFLTLFGNTLGIKGDDLLTLSSGGLLHDVGKMHIPHEVLNKPGKLTDEEFVIMKSHVNCTMDVLSETSELPKGVLIIAGQHHEKLDGTGYPHGIAGANVGELSRMATIIDIFSAITDRRVYKDPVPAEQALKIMINMKDQLDQHLLSVFREMLLDAVK